ncbi:hypothetical protein AB0K23_01400 [Streptomyces sp. NPDC049602]|uniref:hypothetical protein n=1 Tax=Streptomyces sp. NPDC049602 TaxID=3155504 RepID=UPI0034354E9B
MSETEFQKALLKAAAWSTAHMNRDQQKGITPSGDGLAAHAIYKSAAIEAGYTEGQIEAASLNYNLA